MDSVVAGRIATGRHFAAKTGQIIITRLGFVSFVDTARVGAREGPLTPENSRLMTPHDTLVLLDYLGEGHWNSWDDGGVREVDLPWSDGSPAVATSGAMRFHAPRRNWWVLARTARDSGWFVVAPGSVAGSAPHYEDTPPRCAS